MEEIHYLYKITNKVNGKLYIGVTKNPKHRQECHFGKVSQERLVNKAVSKYGKDNFSLDIICIGEKHYIYNLEIEAIKAYNSNATGSHGYNVCSGGFKGDAGNKGRKHYFRSDDKPTYVSGFWFPNKRLALSSLKWGIGKYNSRNKRGMLGEVICKEKRNGPQIPVYVMGFWFNSKSQAINYLTLSSSAYEFRRKNGGLGDEKRKDRKSHSTVLKKPTYFKGFWFPSVEKASDIFDISPTNIRQRILRGRFEENSKIAGVAPKRQYLVLGDSYETLSDASKVLGIPETTIKNRISQNKPSYGYIYIIK